jgi:hypothetical protein
MNDIFGRDIPAPVHGDSPHGTPFVSGPEKNSFLIILSKGILQQIFTGDAASGREEGYAG